MRKKLQLSLILLFTIIIGIKAQDEAGNASNISQTIDMFPKSPEAAALSRFVDIPAGNYTGVADFSIPIYTIEFDGRKIPIALQYSTTGIKVDQIATRVGLGWVLDTGPSLSVQVIGNLDNQDMHERPDIVYFNPNSASSPQDPDYILATRAAGLKQPQFDPEPDIFTYRLLDKSGKYILDRTGAKGVPIPYDQTKIVTTYNNHNVMDLYDEQGFKYNFNSSVDNQILNRNTCVTTIGDFQYNDPNYKIQQIISPNNEGVKFVYTPFVANTKYITSVQTQVALGKFSGSIVGPPAVPNPNIKCINYADSKESVLSEIQFNGGKVLFTYSDRAAELRSDLPGDVYLKSIKVVNNNGQVIKDLILHYDYFSSTDPLPKTSNDGYMNMGEYIAGMNYRLKLTGVTDNLTGGKYVFEYYGNNLPIRTSNDQDFWGVYNGAGNGVKAIASIEIPYYNKGQQYLRANKDPNINYGILGNLKRISYPTGGYTNIEYEADNNGSLTTKIIYEYHTEVKEEEHIYEAKYDYTKNPDLEESTFYIPEKAINKYFTLTKYPPDGTNTNPFSCSWQLYNLDTQKEVGFGTKQISTERNDIAGNYRLYMKRGGDYPPQKCTASYIWEEKDVITIADPTPIDTINVDTKPIGTIRVKKIESFDNNGGKITREYTYRIPTENHLLPYLDSSGIIHGDESFNSKVLRVSPANADVGTAVETLVVNNPGWQISNINGKPIAYSYVQEHYKDDSHPENSYRKEYEFINNQDYDLMYNENNAMSSTWSPGNMENGLLKEEILFNSNNQKVKETYKSYKFDGHFNTKYDSNANNDVSMGNGLKIQKKGAQPYYLDGNPIPAGFLSTFNLYFYSLRNTWIREDSTRIRNYTNGVDYVETLHTNNYSIPSYKHTYPIESISRAGNDIINTLFTYPNDKPNQKLIDANMVGIPLVVETKKNGKTISKTETIYPDILPDAQTGNLLLPTSVSALDLVT
ncbi:hypothetical protein, partial [Epilithonimonas sp.]|uniref:hypothetical protein n=1 Tax=Epilithonimonas sp. TaxID=2894511 RepID=UPI0028A01B7C